MSTTRSMPPELTDPRYWERPVVEPPSLPYADRVVDWAFADSTRSLGTLAHTAMRVGTDRFSATGVQPGEQLPSPPRSRRDGMYDHLLRIVVDGRLVGPASQLRGWQQASEDEIAEAPPRIDGLPGGDLFNDRPWSRYEDLGDQGRVLGREVLYAMRSPSGGQLVALTAQHAAELAGRRLGRIDVAGKTIVLPRIPVGARLHRVRPGGVQVDRVIHSAQRLTRR